MNNPVLTTEFEMGVLNNMSYAQLMNFTKTLANTIKDLEEAKEIAVFSNEDEKAVKYQGYIYNATTNRDTMIVVMLAKEDDVCFHTDTETIWLN